MSGSNNNLHQRLVESGIEWIVCGSQTHPYRPPEISWVREIVDTADKTGIPVWEKNNLFELLDREGARTDFAFTAKGEYRQELPEGLKV